MIDSTKLTGAIAALLSVLLLPGCDHPLQIEGRGDIYSASGSRDCRLEDQPCSNLIQGAYRETYTAVPRGGWRFVGWEGCNSGSASCSFDIPADVVEDFYGQTMVPLVARFERTADRLRVLLLGDSITQGGNGYPGYRRGLWFKLQGAGYDVDFVGSHDDFHGSMPDKYRDFDLDNEGHWAWEAGEVKSSLNSWLSGYTPDLVLLHLGTNDFDRGQSNSGTIGELGAIIDSLRQDNARVIILMATLIPMMGKDTASLNTKIRELAQAKDRADSPVKIVEQYSGYNAYTDNYDKWHPNSVGEGKMADKWFAAMLPYLQ